MKALYRISDNGYVKPKFGNATKKYCLTNFMLVWQAMEEIIIFVDKVTPETQSYLNGLNTTTTKIIPIEGGSSAGSWRIARNYALTLPDDEIVYFVEDDYLHLPGSRQAIIEGIERADYVTLYDCPDKYEVGSTDYCPYQNPLISIGGEETKVILTKHHHWKMTNSTTMTFAVKVKTLREDNEIWKKYTEGDHPHDFNCFLELRERGRTLISPIPTLSTHCEPQWAAPLIDWSKV